MRFVLIWELWRVLAGRRGGRRPPTLTPVMPRGTHQVMTCDTSSAERRRLPLRGHRPASGLLWRNRYACCCSKRTHAQEFQDQTELRDTQGAAGPPVRSDYGGDDQTTASDGIYTSMKPVGGVKVVDAENRRIPSHTGSQDHRSYIYSRSGRTEPIGPEGTQSLAGSLGPV